MADVERHKETTASTPSAALFERDKEVLKVVVLE
jgi:hypothetical protein